MENQEFRNLVASQRMASGMFAEMLVAADIFRRGLMPSKPLANARYDLIVDTGDQLLRLQCKLGSKNYLQVNLSKANTIKHWDAEQVYFERKPIYKDGDWDYLVVVDRKTYEAFYVPAADVDLNKDSFYVKQEDRAKYSVFAGNV